MMCRKCGATMGEPQYHRDRFSGHISEYCGGQWEEHLHYYCRCGYSETRPTRDAKQQREPA